MEAIKPCPFCGEPDALYCLPIMAEYMVRCNTCSASGPRTVRHNDAVLLWNAAANALEAAKHECDNLRDACLGYSQIQASLVEQRDEVMAERDELRNALEAAQTQTMQEREAYATVIAARDEDERLYQDEITRLERQVATLEQQLQTELDMRNTHAVEEVARLVAACDDLEGEYLRMIDQRDEALVTRNAALSKISEMRTMWIDDVKMLQDRNGILLNQRDEARRWAREYKRRLIQAAKAMRGDGND